jgi:ethanolamine utilization protein EutA
LAGNCPVVVLDGIRAAQNQFIDLGRPVMRGLAVPVVVKTILLH